MDTPTPPVADNPPIPQPLNNVIVPPNFDDELNDTLSRAFPEASPKNENKTTESPKVEVQAEKPVEDKPTEKVESKKADKPVESEKQLLSNDEIDKIEPKKQDAWTALKNNNKQAAKIITEREEEIKKLKAVVAERGLMSQKELDALKAENSELSKYRAMIDVQADPEFLKTFDQPMNDKVNEVVELLMQNGVSEETARSIDYNNSTLISTITKQIAESKDDVMAEDFRSLAREARGLINKRNKAAEEQGKNYKEILETRKKQSFERSAEDEGKALKHLEAIASGKDAEGIQKREPIPFLNKITPKETATQPEIDQINAHNKMVDMMQQKVHQAYKVESPEERMELAVAAAAAHYLSAQLKAVKAQTKSLQDELRKISAVNTETEKSKPATIRRNGTGELLTHDEALNAHFGR